MRLIPVLDLLNHVVVRGVAGQRETYRPVESCLTRSADPLAVARAFRDHLGLQTLYVADLDGILRSQPNLEIYRQLADDGFTVWVDAGIRTMSLAESILQTGTDSIIAGWESIPSPALLHDLISRFGPQKILFSLDLQSGRLLPSPGRWNKFVPEAGEPQDLLQEPLHILTKVLECGVRRLIILDLAQVGVGQGISTLPLCSRFRIVANAHVAESVELITGGGVRNMTDLHLLARSQIDGVLVASAFHNGGIDRLSIQKLLEACQSSGNSDLNF